MDSEDASARICLLGKPALFIGGQLQPFRGPRKAIALLAYVLLHRERALSRAAVAEQFWPDEEDESARASLRRHLHRALAALPEAPPKHPWVIADKVTLRWNLEAPLELDTERYERLSADGERESAVVLYRGDYLEDFYEAWMLPERERLRELQSANLVALVDERRRALDYRSAIAFAQELLRLDPLREDAIRALMSLRFAAGDRSGALTEFETFSRRLREELATEPMPETIALREAVRNNDLSTLVSGQVGTVRVARSGYAFVGRGVALQALRNAWESAARGSATTAIVSGEAGVGKSRLIAELTALAEAQGGRVMVGTTATIEAEPYQPVAEALRGALPLLRFDRLEPAKLAALSSLVPRVRELVPNVPQLQRQEPERDRQRLFDAIASTFEQLAEKRPLLVVLEDLHWAGAATIELLEYVVRRLRGKSVLVVGSFREGDVDGSHALLAFLRHLETERCSHVAVGPLEEGDVRALVAGVAAEESDTIAREIFAASNGNALFVTELLRERLNGVAGGTVPTGVAATVIARVNSLSPAARSLVETAAVTGVGFDAEVVRQACGWSFAEVFDALDELLDRALVRISPQRRRDYAFSHQLVHAAVYGTIEEAARRGIHRRVAKTLEQLFPERPSLYAGVARHYDAAGFCDDAVARYLSAVRYALDVFAQGEAIDLASRALQLCTNPRDRFELHRLREQAVAALGDGALWRLDCAAMTQTARELQDDELLGTALVRSIEAFMELGDWDEAASTIALLCECAERTSSQRWAAEAALAKAWFEIYRKNNRGAEAVLAQAESVITALADDELISEFWCWRAYAASFGAPRDARAYLEQAQRLVGESRSREIRVLRAETKLLDLERDMRGLERAATRLLELFLEIGDVEGQALAHQYLGYSLWSRCDIVGQREHIRQALEMYERVQKPQSIAGALTDSGVLAQYTGQFEAAAEYYRRAISIFESTGDWGYQCLGLAYSASLESMRGCHARARELALEAFAFARDHELEPEEYIALEFLGVAERELGDVERARDHFEAVLRYRRERGISDTLETLIEAIPAHVALGASGDAVAAAEELLGGLERDRMRATFPAHALWVAASAFALSGQKERAEALRSEAQALLRELAGRINDEPSREGYLSLRFHRAIFSDVAPPLPPL
jgi:DNA-binding SARP family transcriptional activator